MIKLEALLIRQTLIMQSIYYASTNFCKINKDTITYSKTRNRLDNVKKTWTKYQDQHNKIILLAGDEAQTGDTVLQG